MIDVANLANDDRKSPLAKTQKLFCGVMIGQILLSILIGLFTGNIVVGLLASVTIAAVPIYFCLKQPDKALTRHLVAIAIQLLAALHIQMTMGMTEMHFGVFVMLAFLSFYRDWMVIVTGTLVIAVHHVLGFASQLMGGSIIVFEDAQPAFMILVIHASFAVAECLVLVFMAHQAKQEHAIALDTNIAIGKITKQEGTLDLRDENIPQNPNLKDLAAMLNAFKSLAIQTQEVGAQVANVSDKVKQSSNSLTDTVVDQNGQVNSISDSINSITSSIKEVADLSHNANDIADAAKESTNETTSAINSSQSNIADLKSTLETTSKAISDLSQKCENISTVMQSIKSVAEQTNLLALNAAIESARAGEHGRGFAVVADEVRNLAIKSKESAEEIEKITSLLTESANHSVENMDQCVEVVDRAVSSSENATSNMASVLQSIEQVNHNVTNVATSAAQQASVSETISENAIHLHDSFDLEHKQVESLQDEVTQLNNLADQLNLQLQQFRLA
ncbi:methyl-accepting chemotaxis protein [Glaciecola petra]|uniref:Methyl-accepting chemotaxis protein n=1 Tax=Glaciecola petra TaxID=3075602 RepID=A0ABU2ZSB1_9ALTE|nr:methyl-accepting chemotaxis protein [Aestuariibacter sp. P117]MDT0595517.1 methyl-accepting chemotaxis protein [Aestuariibacter sp. P117]